MSKVIFEILKICNWMFIENVVFHNLITRSSNTHNIGLWFASLCIYAPWSAQMPPACFYRFRSMAHSMGPDVSE